MLDPILLQQFIDYSRNLERTIRWTNEQYHKATILSMSQLSQKPTYQLTNLPTNLPTTTTGRANKSTYGSTFEPTDLFYDQRIDFLTHR